MGVDVDRTKRIYQKLLRVAPDLESVKAYAKSQVCGRMVLHCDILETGQGFRRIALSHYWIYGAGDMIPDPDIEIAVFFDWELAEALTYQDAFRYDDAYPVVGEPPTLSIHQTINCFLENWLDALAEQGHILQEKAVTAV